MDSKKRFAVQAVSTLLHNANIKGFLTGKIYTGDTKGICVPGLNCYSCPGAVGACPIGSLQSALSSYKFRFPYYIVGTLIFIGALLGRAVCGLLCPFGFIQELLNKIPFYKKNRFRGDRALRYLKYAVLLLMVVILPIAVKLTPFFCKYLCPSGTVAALLLSARDVLIRSQLGPLFTWKFSVLTAIVVASLIIWRPFCKYLCPLGALYGFFNKIALYRMRPDMGKCVGCGKCAAVCRMGVDPAAEPNSAECIRCGDCVNACPTGALHVGFCEKKIKNKD